MATSGLIVYVAADTNINPVWAAVDFGKPVSYLSNLSFFFGFFE